MKTKLSNKGQANLAPTYRRGWLALFTAALALAITFTLNACGNEKSSFVGKWDRTDSIEIGEIVVIELLSDGTGIAGGVGITWKIENGRFYVNHPAAAMSWSYKMQGSMLMLTDDAGKAEKYLKREEPDSFTDSRDGKIYRTIKMPDGNVWFAANLNFAAEGSKCYGDNEENCQKYGRLYNWETAKGACPNGWHLPSSAELDSMVISIGGIPTAGKKLKAVSGWNDYKSKYSTVSGNGDGAFGFSALPGGGGKSDGSFGYIGNAGLWWTSTESNSDKAHYGYIVYNNAKVYKDENSKLDLGSIRCIKDKKGGSQ
ncbi:MAG: fibrobacter succinogenes major paralogous domain-containing protein [Fibromonadaceae bacterium]|jgi:uncharacterized protein (TIGR02145 family)|nr:fibrobacter succinogenes major paralogous domain-containing protein [Fibromonadaceae bacterium]